MEKRLHKLGNSLALVVDKPIRKLLGIGIKTRLKVWTDGIRIIAEPLPAQSVIADVADPGAVVAGDEARLRRDANAVFGALVYRGMGQERFDQLHPPPRRRFMAYGGWAEFFVNDATDEDYRTMRRLEACLCALEGGAKWPAAIAVARSAAPLPGEALGDEPAGRELPPDGSPPDGSPPGQSGPDEPPRDELLAAEEDCDWPVVSSSA